MTKSSKNLELSGFINIDKPENWTSHDVVQKLRRLLGIKRIGHCGTLDPFATGVLPIAVASSTRLIRFLPKTKSYLAEIDLRFTTDTDDLTGSPLKLAVKVYDQESLSAEILSLIGTYDQYPPLYSAKKINGKKLYELMREGKSIDLSDIKPKSVTIYDAKLISFEYPLASFEVSCSEGTYIRSIARDLGGHLTKLRRTESNGFDLTSSVRFEDLENADLSIEDLVLPSKDFLKLPEISFERKDIVSLQQGRQIWVEKRDLGDSNLYVKCLDDSNRLVGLAHVIQESGSDFKIQPELIL